MNDNRFAGRDAIATGGARGIGFAIAELGTLTRNEAEMPASLEHAFTALAQPTLLQEKAFRLPEIDPAK